MNRMEEARATLERALELEPDSAPGLYALSKYYARIDNDEMAADALARSIEYGGKDRLVDALNDDDLKDIAADFLKGEGKS